MPASSALRGHFQAGQDAQWFVLTDEKTVDDAQVSGRWIKTTGVMEVQR